MSQRDPATAALAVEPLTRRFVLMELPFVISEGPTTDRVVDSAMRLALGSKVLEPPPGADTPMLCHAPRLPLFQVPLAVDAVVVPNVRSPTVALDCVLTNDALLRVQRRVTVRRVRRRATGELLSEEVVASRATAASWCGVVSRRCSIARPMDCVYLPNAQVLGAATGQGDGVGETSSPFSGAPHTSRNASVVAEGDVFAPAAFVSERVVPSFSFDIDSSQQATVPVVLGDRDPHHNGLVHRRYYMASTDVLPNSKPFPPLPSAAQSAYVRAAADAPEWKVLSELLKKRPVWEGRELEGAMKRCGRCPSAHANVNCVRAMTYSIVRGPFHRLRVAFACDPTLNASFSVLQRIVVRIPRRSPLGVALRDACRIPNIRELIHMTEGANGASPMGCAAPDAAPDAWVLPFPAMRTMRDVVASFVSHGRLWGSIQIVDVMDHSAFRAEALRHIDSYSPQHGFYTEATLQRLSAIVVDQIRALVTVQLPTVLSSGGSGADIGGGALSETDSDAMSESDSSQRKRLRDDSDEFTESSEDA